MSKHTADRPFSPGGTRATADKLVQQGDVSWVADLLAGHRDEILDHWLADVAAQPFHAGHRERTIANHIPVLFDALVMLLHRAGPRGVQPSHPLADPAVLEAARAHARDRFQQGLAAAEVLTEFRRLRQEIGHALRLHLDDSTPVRDVVSAEILLNDALDEAAYLVLSALGDHEAARRRAEDAARQTQAELEAERGLLDALFSGAPVGFALLDHELRYLRINQQLATISGRHAADYLARTVQEMAPDLVAQHEPLLRRVLETGEPSPGVSARTEVSSRPGEVRHWLVSHYPVRDARSAIVGVGLVAMETTAQARAEAALRESEQRFRALADNISQLAWMADRSGWIFWYNRRWFEYTGTTLEEMQGWGWTKGPPPRSRRARGRAHPARLANR